MKPQLSIQLRNFDEAPVDFSALLATAELADRVGVDRVVVSDHVLYGEQQDAYADPAKGGTAGGKQPTTPDGNWLEPLTVLTAIAARTSSVRLGTAILIAALRPAAVLAKQVATLDSLSAGRVDLGVGVGWQREEYEACGLDFTRRGALLDQTLRVCQALWTEQVVTSDDGALRFNRVHQMPKPVQTGGVPIWVSGRINPRTVDRLVRFGAGWLPWGDDIADPAPGVDTLRQALDAAGRDPASLQVQGTLPVVREHGDVQLDATVAGVAPLVAAGITDFRFSRPWGTDVAADEAMLSVLVPAFRSAVGR